MNEEAGLKIKEEYLANFEAVKGPAAREFIEQVAFTFASCDIIAAAIHGNAPKQLGIETMVELLSLCVVMLAEQADLNEEQAQALCDDARSMVDAVNAVTETKILRLQ